MKTYRKGSWAKCGRVLPGRRVKPKRIDQILEDGRVVCTDRDQKKFSPSEINALLLSCFADGVAHNGRVHLKPRAKSGKGVCFYNRNISHLGGDWSSDKKRIQVGVDFPELYRTNAGNGEETILLGVYHYYPDGVSGVTLFACFSSATYASRSTNNSAAHIHTIDLLNAQKKGVYRRLDKSGNELLVLNRENFIRHINSIRGAKEITAVAKDRELLKYLGEMFESLPRKLRGIECYEEMMAANDKSRMNQGAWEGWYYEFYFQRYLQRHPTNKIVWWAKKGQGELDFDFRFPFCKWFYGDVKSDAKGKAVQGNLKSSIDFLVREKGGRLWYVALEFTPEKDSDHRYVTTKWWNERLGKRNKLLSYGKRMKYAITVNRMDVYDITLDTLKYLREYKPSPCGGKERQPKYEIPNKMKEFLRIYEHA